jgi:hypothetical protein
VVKKPTKKQVSLCKGLRQLGFTQGNQMKLYAEQFELRGAPIASGDDLVLVAAIENKSGRSRRFGGSRTRNTARN